MAIRSSAESSEVPSDAREIAGEGVIATVLGSEIAVGNTKLMNRLGISEVDGGSVFVARDGKFIGSLTLGDKIKTESKGAISRIKALGVKKCVILSGDKADNVEKIKSELSLDEAFAELKPEDKYKKLEELIDTADGSVGYVGDGINDAPTLARADVGFAMGAIGSDSAVEAADAVIMSDNLEKIAESIIIARKTISISWQNIIFAIGIKVLVMIAATLGYSNMWAAIFADVGVAVLAIINSLRCFRI
jgi:Cd2+/Zn2+-exporting ATPase